MHEKLIRRRCCFYIDGITKCTIIFKLEILNLHIQNFRYDIKCSFACLSFVLFRIIETECFYCIFCFFRFIQFVLLYNQKNKGTFKVLQTKIKKFNVDKIVKFQGASKSTFMLCAAPTFMLLLYSLVLKFVNNFEVSCQDNEFTVKVEVTLSDPILLMRADDYLINNRFRSQHRHLKYRGCFPQVMQVELCETRLNHVIFLNRQARRDRIFTFYKNSLE